MVTTKEPIQQMTHLQLTMEQPLMTEMFFLFNVMFKKLTFLLQSDKKAWNHTYYALIQDKLLKPFEFMDLFWKY